MGLTFHSHEVVISAFGKATTEDAIKIATGIEKCLGIVLRKAQYYCPVLTGALYASGRIEVEGKGFGTKGTVEFGGLDAPYAVPVHERMDVYHEPPTCAKYLERAARESRGTMTALMKRQIRVSPTTLLFGEGEG